MEVNFYRSCIFGLCIFDSPEFLLLTLRLPLKKLIALILLVAFTSMQLMAWGPKGHALVADIAASRLTPTAKKNIQMLLGNDSLASIASWADQVRKDHD